jgi:hypothetical protein
MYYPALYKKEKDLLDSIHHQSREKKKLLQPTVETASNNDLEKKGIQSLSLDMCKGGQWTKSSEG